MISREDITGKTHKLPFGYNIETVRVKGKLSTVAIDKNYKTLKRFELKRVGDL